ncbi:MAG: DUF3887 domain-containing protein [Synechococcaceae bacterium WB4_1_0192]|jgi:hypothetical protein|nr:DUF3887 domain-containing protein [Synechococcaceae bacterium WB4_1_0192]
MPRRLRPTFTSLGLGASLLLAATGPLLPPVFSGAALAQQSGGAAAGSLSVDEARAAARRILDAVQRGDANARYAQFSDELKAMTSPSMVQATMRSQPKVLRYELLSVRSGLGSSTVEAELTTTAGKRVIFIVLNGRGQISRYYVDRADDPTSRVAGQFVQALSTGNFITAQSFLSPQFQKEVTPASLQAKWLNLQRLTGNFVAVGRVVEAESTPDARLVLVNMRFTRLSDNLFVILNPENQVVGIDFPQDAAPAPAR